MLSLSLFDLINIHSIKKLQVKVVLIRISRLHEGFMCEISLSLFDHEKILICRWTHLCYKVNSQIDIVLG
jgi:hypothetical protein